MSGNGSVTVPPDSTGKIIDCTSLSVGGVVAMRQRVIIADPTSSAGFASVTSGRLNVNAGTVDKISAAVVIASLNGLGKIDGISAAVALTTLNGLGKIDGISAAVVLAAGAAHIGEVNISTMPAVNISVMPAVVLAAGTAKIGKIAAISATVNVAGTFTISTIDKISATTVVAGVVALAAGAANIGTIDGISKTVAVSIASLPPVAISGTAVVAGAVTVTNQVQISNISATVNVAGTFTISTIDKISATTIVAGVVTLAAGTANFGTLQNISATVVTTGVITNTVAVSGQVSVTGSVAISSFPNGATVNISTMPAVVLATGTNNIGTIQAISAAVTIANGATVNISTMPAVVVSGTVNVNGGVAISGTAVAAGLKVGTSGSAALANNTVTVGWCDKFGRQMVGVHPSIVAGATQGPQSFVLTSSAAVVLVASAGASQSIYVTGLLVTNGSGTLLQMNIFESVHSAAPEVVAWCAPSGGGYQVKFDPPWQLSATTALQAKQVPGALTAHVMVQFFLGPA